MSAISWGAEVILRLGTGLHKAVYRLTILYDIPIQVSKWTLCLHSIQ